MKKFLTSILLLTSLIFTLITPVNASTLYDGKTLDTGIYWFGKGNVSQKYVKGVTNPYFNPTKPTMIYIHGWQKDNTKTLFRESFNPSKNDSKNGLNVNSADYWIDKGWNIGIYYWNQLADESEVKDAEAKIWTTSGSKGMRWRKVDGTYVTTGTPTVSVSQLFVNDYISAMSGFTGSEIRFGGHSLGNQVVTNSTKIISDLINSGTIQSKLLPNRVALFDPFWSKDSKSYLGNKWNGEVCRNYVTELKTKGVVFEQYKSSNINDIFLGDSNDGMKKLTAFIDLYPDYISLTDQGGKHGASKDWYYYSMAFTSPKEYLNTTTTGNVSASATTSTTRVKEMMNSQSKWIQYGGKSTATPSDDTFQITPR